MGHGAGAMEDLVVPTSEFWRGRRVLVTGHTGFKGSWLLLWLHQVGAELVGFGLEAPTAPSLFVQAGLSELCTNVHGDVRDGAAVRRVVSDSEPSIVLHLAAQPLVRESYRTPVATVATNVMGTVHLLDAIREQPSVKAAVMVTTDKVYENRESIWGYREDDALGGHDPYSASKACADLLTSSYRRGFFAGPDAPGIASARAGNVIGGGDWAADRLIPDLVRAVHDRAPCAIRNPGATRPWQHVLEPLAGYLILAERLVEDRGLAQGAWNFGPRDEDAISVDRLSRCFTEHWSPEAAEFIVADTSEQPHEAGYLHLDWTRARRHLNWAPRWDVPEAVARTVRLYKTLLGASEVGQARSGMMRDIFDYMEAR